MLAVSCPYLPRILAYAIRILAVSHPAVEKSSWCEKPGKKRVVSGARGVPRNPCRCLTRHATSGFCGNSHDPPPGRQYVLINTCQ